MNLTDWLSGVRTILDDPTGSGGATALQSHSTKQLVEVGHQQLLAIVKRMAEVDERWHNHEFVLLATAARQVAFNVWEYTIPPWLMTITDMREEGLSGVTGSLGPRVWPIQSKSQGGIGYDFQSGNSLRLYGKSTAPDLRVQCTKRPARPTMGTLPAQTLMSATQLRLDVDPAVTADYPHEKLTDAYAGSFIEITGVNDATAQPGGQLRRCLSSAHTQLFVAGPNTLHTVLTLESAWTVTPETNDTYEMHWELPEQHVRLHQLMTARAMWQRQGNADEVRAHRDEMAELGMSLINDVKKRQSQAPKRMVHCIGGDYGSRRDWLNDPLSWQDLYG